MKKILPLLAVVLALIASCSENDDSSGSGNATLLKKAVVTDADGFSNTFEYDYDGNRLTGITLSDEDAELFVLHYTYSQSKLIKSERFDEGELSVRTIYSYDTQGKLSQTTTSLYNIFDGGNYVQQSSYTHNADGTISSEVYAGEEGSLVHVTDGLYQFENGNITGVTIFDTANTYTYDTRNSPMKNIAAADVINLDLGSGGPNNILSYTGDGQPFTYTYTYNSDNYPVTAEQSIGGSVYTTHYYYE